MIHMYVLMIMKAKNKLDCIILQEAIAYLSLIMLISAAVSSGITKKLVGKIGSKVTILETEEYKIILTLYVRPRSV